MNKSLFAFFLLICFAAPAALYAQAPVLSEWKKDRDPDSTTVAQVREGEVPGNKGRWSIGFYGGYGKRLFRTGIRRSRQEEKYLDDLKSGIFYGGDATIFPWKNVGIGVKYDRYEASAKAADGFGENVTVEFMGGTLVHRARLKDGRTAVLTSLLLGYQPYRNKTTADVLFTVTARTMGWGLSVGLERKLGNHFAIHLTGTALLGAAYRIQRQTPFNKETLHLSKDDSVDLSRASLTLGFRFM